MKTPLLWYELFANMLKEEGFCINSYDNCVANKMINSHQFTICWYADDIMFSHKNKSTVNDVIKRIKTKFDNMTVTHENVQSYLGMELEIKNKQVHMNMK